MSLVAHLNEAIGCWNRGDLHGYLGLYDEGIRLHGYTPDPMDKTQVASFYGAIFENLPADGRASPLLVIEDALEAGNRLACRFTMSGRQTGPFMGVPASGRTYVLPGLTILHFSGGKAV